MATKTTKKNSLRTSEDVFNRLRWGSDQLEINLDEVVIGYTDAKKHAQRSSELPFHEWLPIKDGGEIPMHHIKYFATNDTLLWDKASKVDRLFNSGVGKGRSAAKFRVGACLPKKYWHSLLSLQNCPANRNRTSSNGPIIPIAHVELPETESLCGTTLARWAQRIFGEDEDCPFQPLEVSARLEYRLSESNPANAEIILRFQSKNLLSLRKLLSCDFTPFNTTLPEATIVLAVIEAPKVDALLVEMNEKFEPFTCNLTILDLFDHETGKFVGGFSLETLHLLTENREKHLEDASTTFQMKTTGTNSANPNHPKAPPRIRKKAKSAKGKDERIWSAGFVIFRGQEVLVIDRGAGYEFAKGRREEGETVLKTAHRELAEESGLKLPDKGFKILLEQTLQHSYFHRKRELDKTVDYVPVQLDPGVELLAAEFPREAETKTVEFVPFAWLVDIKNRKEVKKQLRAALSRSKLKKLILNETTSTSAPVSPRSK